MVLLIIDLILPFNILAPESWPLNRNIVRAIVQGESEEAISFIKANELKTVDDKILVLGDKFDTTITNLYFVEIMWRSQPSDLALETNSLQSNR